MMVSRLGATLHWLLSAVGLTALLVAAVFSSSDLRVLQASNLNTAPTMSWHPVLDFGHDQMCVLKRFVPVKIN